MLREMIYRLNDDDAAVVKANHASLTVLSAEVPAEELVNHVEFIRNLLASLVSDARRRKGGVGDGEFLLPGFNIPKGESFRCSPRSMINMKITYCIAPTIKRGASISLSD
jgi:hypothetical protein